MDIKTKSELLGMSKEELEAEENQAWSYFTKVKAVMKFTELED